MFPVAELSPLLLFELFGKELWGRRSFKSRIETGMKGQRGLNWLELLTCLAGLCLYVCVCV